LFDGSAAGSSNNGRKRFEDLTLAEGTFEVGAKQKACARSGLEKKERASLLCLAA
jgi:hypothetical protein